MKSRDLSLSANRKLLTDYVMSYTHNFPGKYILEDSYCRLFLTLRESHFIFNAAFSHTVYHFRISTSLKLKTIHKCVSLPL